MLGFLSGGAGDVHACLDHMNRLDHIRIGVDVVLDARDRLRVLEQALHLGLGAAVAQLQVVQHGVVLLGKPLIG